MPKLGMSGDVPLFIQYAFMVCKRTTFYFPS